MGTDHTRVASGAVFSPFCRCRNRVREVRQFVQNHRRGCSGAEVGWTQVGFLLSSGVRGRGVGTGQREGGRGGCWCLARAERSPASSSAVCGALC